MLVNVEREAQRRYFHPFIPSITANFLRDKSSSRLDDEIRLTRPESFVCLLLAVNVGNDEYEEGKGWRIPCQDWMQDVQVSLLHTAGLSITFFKNMTTREDPCRRMHIRSGAL